MPVLSFTIIRAFVAALLTLAFLGGAVLLEASQPPTKATSLGLIWVAWFLFCLTIPEPPKPVEK